MALKLVSTLVLLSQPSVIFSNQLNTSYFEFFYGKDYYDVKTDYPLYAPSKILNDLHFDNKLPTMMFLDGYKDNLEDVFGRMTMVDAFLSRGDYNVINVNWDKVASGNYVFEVFPNTRKYGEVLGDAILRMADDGLNFDKLHIVGHSLGSQLASFVGRAIIKNSGGKRKLKRITGLDPAFPLFYPGWLAGHISESDADLVDVIHTDGIIYGTPFKTGTVDYWPNGGFIFQPGCPQRGQLLSIQDLCAHMRSVEFFAESVRRKNEKTFMARRCNSWRDFESGNCEKEHIHMGMDCPRNATGDYYLETNKLSPYSRGMEGLQSAAARRLRNTARPKTRRPQRGSSFTRGS